MTKPILLPFAGAIRDFSESFWCQITPQEDCSLLTYGFGKEDAVGVSEVFESWEAAKNRRKRICDDILRVKNNE